MIQCKRVYDTVSPDDGYRVLVDRLWPRGIKKQDLVMDQWCKDIAPSNTLRQWFHANPASFSTFSERYYLELTAHTELCQALLTISQKQNLTLLFSTKDTNHNQAVVLKSFLEQNNA